MPDLKSLSIVFAAALVIVAVLTSSPHEAQSQGAGFVGIGKSSGTAADGRKLFGGRIQEVHYCTCPINGVWLYLKVGPPVPQEIVLDFFTSEYRWKAYLPQNWTLGDALPTPLPCLDAGKECYASRQGFPAIHIGTSLIPGV